jgi:hypothetical protein
MVRPFPRQAHGWWLMFLGGLLGLPEPGLRKSNETPSIFI